jgi:hypothetical protein
MVLHLVIGHFVHDLLMNEESKLHTSSIDCECIGSPIVKYNVVLKCSWSGT